LQKSYADLFRTYPDAHRKDNEALRNYFSAHTKVADSTLGLIVSTFKALCAIADFDNPANEPETPAAASTPERPKVALKEELAERNSAGRAPAININIQLQLPATDDGKIYDNLFAAMKKHLFP
jgi:hypothetical protein